ncbi:glycosyltransferase [Clostridium cellulovorans]|uniref:Glycosyl transferase family 28 n=2 Tax=Clostridium cellulovorans TaxID=1493 RepID=D9SRX8_CLOC7|nr:nucleotide disphospho-sugar-binding domain-containing protein [Clostridium cellulovorans]ADL50495.1 glycosyl transferase family 28 [Clostridium cellulovorans 743B]BAV13181.1 glycosyl transferase related to UDP-glucuronosyltransferase [Clostridium cellulovorans]
MANVIITTHWSDGDVIPFINIGKHLKKNGHEVTIFTHCVYEEKAKEVGINFIAWDTWDEYRELMDSAIKYTDTIAAKQEIQLFQDRYESIDVRMKEYELLKPYCIKEDTILIAKNRSSIAALMLAEKMNLPLIWVYMNPYEYESIINYNNINSEKLCEEANKLREKVGLEPIESWLAWQYSPKIQIGLWPEWYKSDIVNIPKKIRLVGFPLESIDKSNSFIPNDLIEILIEQPSPIVISGGTSKKIRSEFYNISIEAAAKFNRKVIVATKYKELLPNKIPENVLIFDYIPLYDVLSFSSLIIHHGGIGTTSNALSVGTPQLILADYIDRPLNGAIVKQIGLGEYLPPLRWNYRNITDSIEKLLNLEYKEKCFRFSESHREEKALEIIECIVNDAKENDEYLIDYETIKGCIIEKTFNSTINKEKVEDTNGTILSKDIKKHLLERMKKR